MTNGKQASRRRRYFVEAERPVPATSQIQRLRWPLVVQLDRYVDFVLRRRWWVIGVAVLLMTAMAAGGNRVIVANDFRQLLGKDNPELAALNALEDTYAASNTVLIAVAPREGSLFTRPTLGAVEELTRDAWQTPHALRIDSLTNYNHTYAEGDDLIVEALVDGAGTLSDDDLVRIEEVALSEPELVGRLVSRDGRVGALAVSFVKTEDQNALVTEVPDYLHAVLEETRARHPDLGFYLTGDVILNRTTAAAMEDGVQSTLPIGFLLILVGTALLLRSLYGVVAIVVMMLFGILTTIGFAGWTGLVLSPLTSAVPVVVMVLAVAHSIHIITAVLLAMGRGLDRQAAVADALHGNAWPVFLTLATTMIGFLSLNSSDSPPVQVMGNLSAFGMLSIYVYSMTLLPAMLSILPLRSRILRSEHPPFFERFGSFVVNRRKILLWSGLILSVAAIAGIPRNEFSDDWTKAFDERYQFRRDTDFIIKNLTGLNTLEYSLEAGKEGAITDPDYLRKVEAFADWTRNQPEVTHVQAFTDIMKRLNRNMHGDDPAHYRLPDDSELAAQYLLLYELSIPFGGDLNDRIDIAKSATRMTVTLADLPVRYLRDIDRRALSWVKANTPGLTDRASGLSVVFAYLTQRNLESMLRGTMIGMALISAILIWVFRSLRLGLISLVPNFLPPALVFGLWGYVIGQVSLAATITTIIAFGIIVDDTIHFMTKYLRGRRDGLLGSDAVRYAFRTTGHALFTTSAVLTAGFIVFAFSGYEGVWVLGWMVTMMVVLGIIVDFLLLPPLLLALDRRKA